MTDFHTETWKRNKEFRKFMFRKYFIFWYFWDKKIKRQFAKTWNHAKSYGASNQKLKELISFKSRW